MVYYIEPEDALRLIEVLGGEEARRVAAVLMENPEISDMELAEVLGMDIKQVRKVLHRLLELSLVTYVVGYDKENARRIFRWRLHTDQLVSSVRGQVVRIIDRLKAIKGFYSQNQVYWCGKVTCRKLDFPTAVDHFFKCPTCGGRLEPFDPTEFLQAVDEKIKQLQRFLR
jgi:transcription initiation factor TFIIE subunit alpha